MCCATNATGDSNVWSTVTENSVPRPGVCGIQNDGIPSYVW